MDEEKSECTDCGKCKHLCDYGKFGLWCDYEIKLFVLDDCKCYEEKEAEKDEKNCC